VSGTFLANASVMPRVRADEAAAWVRHSMFNEGDCAAAAASITSWPGYAPTRLLSLPAFAVQAGVAAIDYKDESSRFGLKSFKALGGAYAVQRVLEEAVRNGIAPQDFTVASATAGNHGRSVAWGARMFGCPCVIYLHRGVGAAREAAIAAFGARIVRVEGDYDESVRRAAADAAANGWTVVSDTSYEGYVEIPRLVMLGYTVMLGEIVRQLHAPPTHVIAQAGVGGLAAAAAAYLVLAYGAARPRFTVVEPVKSDCLYQSALHGAPARATGGLGSILLGLDCGDVSRIAWDVLYRLADDFVLIEDAQAIDAVRDLNRAEVEGSLVAGECSGAGLAVLRSSALRARLGLDAESRVLVFGTEGDTDPLALRALLAG
jgi:diaminopropionate ammonia-lyase